MSNKISTCASDRQDPDGLAPLFNRETGEVVGTLYYGKVIYDGGKLYRERTNKALEALASSSSNSTSRLTREKSLTELLGGPL